MNYLLGIDLQKREFENKMWSYLNGEWRLGGWWYYYIYALAIKEPLGTWVLMAMAVALTVVDVWRRRRSVVARPSPLVPLPPGEGKMPSPPAPLPAGAIPSPPAPFPGEEGTEQHSSLISNPSSLSLHPSSCHTPSPSAPLPEETAEKVWE